MTVVVVHWSSRAALDVCTCVTVCIDGRTPDDRWESPGDKGRSAPVLTFDGVPLSISGLYGDSFTNHCHSELCRRDRRWKVSETQSAG